MSSGCCIVNLLAVPRGDFFIDSDVIAPIFKQLSDPKLTSGGIELHCGRTATCSVRE
jgi:hypothetical protein